MFNCREKLPRYDIDISFMFDIDQNQCNGIHLNLLSPGEIHQGSRGINKHPLKPKHKK